MVRIINGEIVQDDDPRLKQRKQFGSQPSNPAAPRRFGDLNSNNDYSTNPQAPQGRHESTSQEFTNPLDLAAKALGIQNNFITIPEIPFLKMSASKIGLIYVIIVALLWLIFGVKALLFSILVFVLWKHSLTR